MHYLELRAVPGTSGLFDEHVDRSGRSLTRADIQLPDEIWDQLELWVSAYEPVLRLDDSESASRILELDEEGMAIVELIKCAVPECKIKYFSYGLARLLYSKRDLDEIRQLYDAQGKSGKSGTSMTGKSQAPE